MDSGGIVFDSKIYRLPEEGEDFDEGDEDFDLEPERGPVDGIGSLDDDDVTATYVQRYKGRPAGGLEDDDYGNADSAWNTDADAAGSRLGYSRYLDDDEDEDVIDDEEDDGFRLPI
jgi:hypothetical protein